MKRLIGDRSGFALVLTLVVTALMVAVATEMIHQVYVDTALSRGFRDGQQASILAESGVTGGAKIVQLGLTGRDYTALTDKWATPIKLEDEAGSIEITIVEESGRLNLNGLILPNGDFEAFTHAALKRLGKRVQLPEEAWGALADWLDKDDLPRAGGAETPYYQTLKPGYSARNGKLTTLTELTLVKGFTPELYGKLRPFVTVYSDQSGAPVSMVNINTAPKEVLTALDDRIDERMAERILEERKKKPFRTISELSRIPGMDTIAIGLQGKVGVKGGLFRILSVAKVKEAGRAVEAVVRLSGGAPEFLWWQEY